MDKEFELKNDLIFLYKTDIKKYYQLFTSYDDVVLR